MHVNRVEFVGLRTQLPSPAVFSWGSASQRNVGLVRVECGGGPDGWGESSVTFPLWSLEERAATVNGIAPLFENLDITSAEGIVDAVASARAKTDRLRLLWSHTAISSALGAIEMAMWDAWGKHHGEPTWRLLGGSDLQVPLYAVGFGGTPEDVAAQAADAIDEGYSAVKVRVGFDQDDDIELVRTVTERVGEGVLADANMGWSRADAATMVRRLEPYRLGWLEEPLSRDDMAGYRELRALTDTPLAAGENCYSETELVDLARSGLVDVVMPDLARVGGMIAAIAGAHAALEAGRGYSTHHYASDVGFAAMLALCAVVGGPRPVLRDMGEWPVRSGLLSEPILISGGHAQPFAGAGMTPDLRPDVVEEYRVL